MKTDTTVTGGYTSDSKLMRRTYANAVKGNKKKLICTYDAILYLVCSYELRTISVFPNTFISAG